MRKAASTGVLPVLAVAASLGLFGCGGDSTAQTTSEPHPSAAATGAAQANAPSSEQKGSTPAPTAKGTPKGAEGGKQGPPVAAPKGPREPAPSAQERSEATLVSMSLKSPALAPGPESISALPATYTCDGKDTWPILRWDGVPPGAAELALTVLNIEPVNGALFFDWAVAGLDPRLTEIDSGRLPKGAVLGRNSFGKDGYSICPPGHPETYIFTLYALPRALGARKGFDPAALRKQILAQSGNAGLLAVSYGRR